jgi:hypothetical protein
MEDPRLYRVATVKRLFRTPAQPKPETWYHDVPVREIQNNIALVDADPAAKRLTHEQRVAVVYGSVIARVLLERAERYDELHYWFREAQQEPGAFDPMRKHALEHARVIAELFLSARREEVDISEASLGPAPLGALLALHLIESCLVLLADEEPDPLLLLTSDELDLFLHNEHMEQWWKETLPSGEIAPPPFGTGEQPAATPATDAADVERAIRAQAACLESSTADYRALLSAREQAPEDDGLRDRATRRAVEIAKLTVANFKRNIDFSMLGEALNPVSADVVLLAIAHSCVVLAAPTGDFDRYGMIAGELEDALAGPDIAAWRRAVAELP